MAINVAITDDLDNNKVINIVIAEDLNITVEANQTARDAGNAQIGWRWVSGTTYEAIPLTVAEAKAAKKEDLNNHAFSLMQDKFPALETIEHVKLVREQWLSIVPGSRSATTDFQYLIDVYQERNTVITTIDAMSDVPTIEAYDVANDPTWPTP